MNYLCDDRYLQEMNTPCASCGYARCKDKKFVIVLPADFEALTVYYLNFNCVLVTIWDYLIFVANC